MGEAQLWEEVRVLRQRIHDLANKLNVIVLSADAIVRLDREISDIRKRLEGVPVLEESLKNLTKSVAEEAERTRRTVRNFLTIASLALGILTVGVNVALFLLSHNHL